MTLVVQSLPANAGHIETQVRSLGTEEGMETHSSIFAWRVPWAEEAGGLQPKGS